MSLAISSGVDCVGGFVSRELAGSEHSAAANIRPMGKRVFIRNSSRLLANRDASVGQSVSVSSLSQCLFCNRSRILSSLKTETGNN